MQRNIGTRFIVPGRFAERLNGRSSLKLCPVFRGFANGFGNGLSGRSDNGKAKRRIADPGKGVQEFYAFPRIGEIAELIARWSSLLETVAQIDDVR